MPLSSPAPRRQIHWRDLDLHGYRRDDGLWDIEGRLTDTKSYKFHNDDRGDIFPGEPIHEMWLRLTLDDDYSVVAVEAVTDHSPFRICPSITGNFQRLVGLTVGTGWLRAVRERLGGVEGCTHLVELLGPMATVAFQTMAPILHREQRQRAEAEGVELPKQRPALIDTCHAFRGDGEVVRRTWPDYYTGPAKPAAGPAE